MPLLTSNVMCNKTKMSKNWKYAAVVSVIILICIILSLWASLFIFRDMDILIRILKASTLTMLIMFVPYSIFMVIKLRRTYYLHKKAIFIIILTNITLIPLAIFSALNDIINT